MFGIFSKSFFASFFTGLFSSSMKFFWNLAKEILSKTVLSSISSDIINGNIGVLDDDDKPFFAGSFKSK
ncbi:hypothetical protein V4B17_05205 [Bartonella sp. B23]